MYLTRTLKSAKLTANVYLAYIALSQDVDTLYRVVWWYLCAEMGDVAYYWLRFSNVQIAASVLFHHTFVLVAVASLFKTKEIGLYNIYPMLVYKLVSNWPEPYKYYKHVCALCYACQAMVPTCLYIANINKVVEWNHLMIILYMSLSTSIYLMCRCVFAILQYTHDVSVHISYKKYDEYVMQRLLF